MNSFDCALQLDSIRIANGSGFVVRDDLLAGGTKQRAIVPFIEDRKNLGNCEFVYASPFCGFAQVALACAVASTGVECIIFAEKTSSGMLHRFSETAREMGALVIACENLAEAETRAAHYASQGHRRFKIPLGFDDPIYKAFLKSEIQKLWPKISCETGHTKNLWLPVGSATLVQVFRAVVPRDVQIHCVDVHVLKQRDDRIQAIYSLPNTK